MSAAKTCRIIFGTLGPFQRRGAYKISHHYASVIHRLDTFLQLDLGSGCARKERLQDVNSIQGLGEKG
jgi:hypothetical protein